MAGPGRSGRPGVRNIYPTRTRAPPARQKYQACSAVGTSWIVLAWRKRRCMPCHSQNIWPDDPRSRLVRAASPAAPAAGAAPEPPPPPPLSVLRAQKHWIPAGRGERDRAASPTRSTTQASVRAPRTRRRRRRWPRRALIPCYMGRPGRGGKRPVVARGLLPRAAPSLSARPPPDRTRTHGRP